MQLVKFDSFLQGKGIFREKKVKYKKKPVPVSDTGLFF